MKLKDMHESLDNELTDPEYAAIYLNDALNDGSVEEFLLALRNVVRVNQIMEKAASETDLDRETLYKALSESNNPQFMTVNQVLAALGLQFCVGQIS
ncbi:MAG: addiction module antidote protein [Cyanobacteria bacterium P01_G01_bin.19]